MRIKNLISIILLSGGIMGTGLYSSDDHQKIRSRFNIQGSCCAIRTNSVLGFSNRKGVLREDNDSTGATSSSTNAMMLMEDGENEISLEIRTLRWFPDKPANIEERGHFSQKAGHSLNLIRFVKQEETILSPIRVTINQQGVLEAQSNSIHPVIRKEILTEQAEPGFIDPNYLNETYFPKGVRVYQFAQKVSVAGSPERAWTRATPFTGSDKQLRKLKVACIKMAVIISSGDRAHLKASHKEVLKAWPVTTDDSEDEILLLLYPKKEIEDKKAKVQSTRWGDYAIRVMNNERMVQLCSKSKPTHSSLTHRFIDEDGDEVTGYYAPVFSLTDGQLIPVT